MIARASESSSAKLFLTPINPGRHVRALIRSRRARAIFPVPAGWAGVEAMVTAMQIQTPRVPRNRPGEPARNGVAFSWSAAW
jgi:hypothetical protein